MPSNCNHPNCAPFYRCKLAGLMLPHGHDGPTTAQPTTTATVATLKVGERTGFAPLVQSFAKVRYLNSVVARTVVALALPYVCTYIKVGMAFVVFVFKEFYTDELEGSLNGFKAAA